MNNNNNTKDRRNLKKKEKERICWPIPLAGGASGFLGRGTGFSSGTAFFGNSGTWKIFTDFNFMT